MITYSDIYSPESLCRIHQQFGEYLEKTAPSLYSLYTAPFQNDSQSQMIVALAPYVENFVGTLFDIEKEVSKLQGFLRPFDALNHIKQNFIRRYAIKKYGGINPPKPQAIVTDEIEWACQVSEWLKNEEANALALEEAAAYGAWAVLTPEGQRLHKGSFLFHFPSKLDYQNLLQHTQKSDQGEIRLNPEYLRQRDGFNLTDLGGCQEEALREAHYCIVCHPQKKDSCSKGLLAPTGRAVNKHFTFETNPLNNTLSGCPLEQKISEMNLVYREGFAIGALAIIMIDNPLVPATGHRICNACAKACIFQKQTPVDIPGIETQILNAVLDLPYGPEIYSLLTRWNPLNFRMPLPLAPSEKTVLVAGMGPSGFTLAYYLLRQGHTVLGIDGLKIEPFSVRRELIKSKTELFENLDERLVEGFGGVAEYGITVRWNKNYLKLIRLVLEREERFQLVGAVRLGGNITINQTFDEGIDHMALCLGAGKPKMIGIKNELAPGVRQAYDFLMALQLTGAAQRNALAGLQIQWPGLVVGGGLTAIDCATEMGAYYIRQVEEIALNYIGKENIVFERQNQEAITTFLDHGREVIEERKKAALEYRPPNFVALLKKWGGIKIVYRKEFNQSPSYRLSHGEVQKALEEGIEIVENAVPLEVITDDFGHAEGLLVEIKGRQKVLKAKSIMIAAGTEPNHNLLHDIPSEINFLPEESTHGDPGKPHSVSFIIRQDDSNQGVSLFGDMNPLFSGSVVNAMASAKRGYPEIDALLKKRDPHPNATERVLSLKKRLMSRVLEVSLGAKNCFLVKISSPAGALNYRPGQFFRLQHYTATHGAAMEGIALRPIKVSQGKGEIDFLVYAAGASSAQIQYLQEGETVALMGPTGAAFDLEVLDSPILFLAEGLIALQLLPLVAKAREFGQPTNMVILGDRETFNRFQTYLEDLNSVHFCESLDQLNSLWPGLPQKFSNVVLNGGVGFLQGFQKLREQGQFNFLTPYHECWAPMNTAMQCMLKEICAQCIQKTINPVTGEESVIFACAQGFKRLETIDLENLRARLNQNKVSEGLKMKKSMGKLDASKTHR
jgi:NADPH-dependent glutamate synthase beta subunit-like oxidoreductase/NAD(P)H-flavin reductase